MAYATVYQVLARNAARATYTATSVPNTTQVVEFLEEAAGQLDAWLYDGGYAAPFASAIAVGQVSTSAQMLLQRWNALGAALAVEESAQQSDRLPAFQKMWDEVKKACVSQDLPLPILSGKAFPRGFGAGRGTAVAQRFLFEQTTPASPGHWDL